MGRRGEGLEAGVHWAEMPLDGAEPFAGLHAVSSSGCDAFAKGIPARFRPSITTASLRMKAGLSLAVALAQRSFPDCSRSAAAIARRNVAIHQTPIPKPAAAATNPRRSSNVGAWRRPAAECHRSTRISPVTASKRASTRMVAAIATSFRMSLFVCSTGSPYPVDDV